MEHHLEKTCLTVLRSESIAITPFCCESQGRCHHSDGNVCRKANVMTTEGTETSQSGRARFITPHLLKTGLLHVTSINPFSGQCHYNQATICHLLNVSTVSANSNTPGTKLRASHTLWDKHQPSFETCSISILIDCNRMGVWRPFSEAE